jgi:hypothetical protein
MEVVAQNLARMALLYRRSVCGLPGQCQESGFLETCPKEDIARQGHWPG